MKTAHVYQCLPLSPFQSVCRRLLEGLKCWLVVFMTLPSIITELPGGVSCEGTAVEFVNLVRSWLTSKESGVPCLSKAITPPSSQTWCFGLRCFFFSPGFYFLYIVTEFPIVLSRNFYFIGKIIVLQQENLKEPFNNLIMSCLKIIVNPTYSKHSTLDQLSTKLCFPVILLCLHESCCQVVWCVAVLQVPNLLSKLCVLLELKTRPWPSPMMQDQKQENLTYCE